MKLFIEEENGIPKNHPATEENLLEIWGCVPDHWKSYVKTEKPSYFSAYEKYGDMELEFIDGAYKEVWPILQMTAEEKSARQKEIHEWWISRPNYDNFVSWIFDDAICQYVSPSPKPSKYHVWSGFKNDWIIMPIKPTDGIYTFDMTTETWNKIG
jgi:hypothetical protein